MRTLRSNVRFFILLALMPTFGGNLQAGNESQGESSALAGKVFVGQLGEGAKNGGGDTYKDTFTFKEGKFHSAACDPWDFGPGAYTTSTQNGAVYFEAETTSPTDGHMVWKGRTRGNKLKGTMLWYPEAGREPIAYWFSADAQ